MSCISDPLSSALIVAASSGDSNALKRRMCPRKYRKGQVAHDSRLVAETGEFAGSSRTPAASATPDRLPSNSVNLPPWLRLRPAYAVQDGWLCPRSRQAPAGARPPSVRCFSTAGAGATRSRVHRPAPSPKHWRGLFLTRELRSARGGCPTARGPRSKSGGPPNADACSRNHLEGYACR